MQGTGGSDASSRMDARSAADAGADGCAWPDETDYVPPCAREAGSTSDSGAPDVGFPDETAQR